jgi:hypothetical protein
MVERGKYRRMVLARYMSVVVLVALVGRDPASVEAAPGEEELFKIDAQQERAAVEENIAKARRSVAENNLRDARGLLFLIEGRVKAQKKVFSREDRKKYESILQGIENAIEQKEDSLVQRNLEILNTQGVQPAVEFLERTLRASGVSEKKFATIDRAISEIGPVLAQKAAEEEAARRAQQTRPPEPPKEAPERLRQRGPRCGPRLLSGKRRARRRRRRRLIKTRSHGERPRSGRGWSRYARTALPRRGALSRSNGLVATVSRPREVRPSAWRRWNGCAATALKRSGSRRSALRATERTATAWRPRGSRPNIWRGSRRPDATVSRRSRTTHSARR